MTCSCFQMTWNKGQVSTRWNPDALTIADPVEPAAVLVFSFWRCMLDLCHTSAVRLSPRAALMSHFCSAVSLSTRVTRVSHFCWPSDTACYTCITRLLSVWYILLHVCHTSVAVCHFVLHLCHTSAVRLIPRVTPVPHFCCLSDTACYLCVTLLLSSWETSCVILVSHFCCPSNTSRCTYITLQLSVWHRVFTVLHLCNIAQCLVYGSPRVTLMSHVCHTSIHCPSDISRFAYVTLLLSVWHLACYTYVTLLLSVWHLALHLCHTSVVRLTPLVTRMSHFLCCPSDTACYTCVTFLLSVWRLVLHLCHTLAVYLTPHHVALVSHLCCLSDVSCYSYVTQCLASGSTRCLSHTSGCTCVTLLLSVWWLVLRLCHTCVTLVLSV
jgi:hypothetical protein